MAEGQPAPIEHSIWIDAPPEVVFDYLTDPQKLVRWMGVAATLDAAPGGIYEVQFKEGWISRGAFTVVERPRRLVYTLGWVGNAEFPPGSTSVEFTLSPERKGTRLVLRHFGPPSKGLESDGWAMYLERLTAVAEGRESPPDPFVKLAP
jgi:uncharacterized protein YndB with AHSA1/START domain